jgi:hypothetical protein
MNRFFFLACLVAYHGTSGQNQKPKRLIAYFDTPVEFSENWNDNLQNELFDAAIENKINLYRFRSFTKEPEEISKTTLCEIMEDVTINDFPKWNAAEEYWPARYQYDEKNTWLPASIVSFNKKLFEAKRQTIKVVPTDTTYWNRTAADFSFSTIGLDFVVTPQSDTVLQYIHFFKKEMTYCVSFRASEAVPLLNASLKAWFPNVTNFALHVVGDLFMFDSRQYKPFNDLWSQLDTVKLGIEKPAADDYTPTVLLHLRDGKINDFILGHGEYKVYGEVPISKIRKLIDADRQEFWFKGDALANFKMLRLGKSKSVKEFKPLKFFGGNNKGRQIEQLKLVLEESFDFKDQKPDNKFVEDMNQFLHLVYEGVSENKIKVYQDESVHEPYPPNALVKSWSRFANYEWEKETYYELDYTVSYKNEFYTSLITNNGANPENDPQKWKRGEVTIVQPESIRSFVFKSISVFDTHGNLLEKNYTVIEMGLLGFFRYDEIREYISKANPPLWKNIFKWIGENGVFKVQPTSLTAKE